MWDATLDLFQASVLQIENTHTCIQTDRQGENNTSQPPPGVR